MDAKKEKFIQEHVDEIIPIIHLGEKTKQYLREIAGQTSGTSGIVLSEKQSDEILEQFETKVFFCEKQTRNFNQNAKRVLLTASEPLAFLTIAPIIDALKSDRRCRAIEMLADNVAGEQFKKQKDQDFIEIDDKGKPILADVLKPAEEKPFDVVIVTVDPKNSPNSVALFGGKSVFGAKKLYFISSGWVGVGDALASSYFGQNRRKNMDKIDGIFCNDELAKKVLLYQLPEFPEEKIMVTGTPIVDGLERERADFYEKEGRRKLGLSEKEKGILYLGDVSSDYAVKSLSLDLRINEETFSQTLKAMVRFSLSQPENELVLAIRPHPRDPNKEEPLEPPNTELPKNLRIVLASEGIVSMHEAAYASEIIISIISTETFLAPLRGKKGIFLGYKESGLGGKVLDEVLGKEIVEIVAQGEHTAVTPSPEDLVAKLKDSLDPEKKNKTLKEPQISSITKILDVALGE